jgi:hypothetical protein
LRKVLEVLNTPMAVLTALLSLVVIDCYLLFFRRYWLGP